MPDDRLLKQVVYWIMEGSNRKERPIRGWKDHMKEWCSNDLHMLSRKAADLQCFCFANMESTAWRHCFCAVTINIAVST